MTPVLADTGFLVALFRPADALAGAAVRYLERHRHPLMTVSATLVETCFFLNPASKAGLLSWVRRGALALVDVPLPAYASIEATLRKHADRDVDFVDAALVWLADESGARKILTVDQRDFQLFRLGGGRRFELIDWY